MPEAKLALDKIMRKGRVHLYKPIQVAEILYRSRVFKDIDLNDLESYRNRSKQWRDAVSIKLVGNVSTSSQKFQDNLFEENAMLPELLKQLDKINISNDGTVENYIYHQCKQRWGLLLQVDGYLNKATTASFKVEEMVNWFTTETGLKKSIDKVYEISVHALFSTIVEELKAKVSLEIENPNPMILNDFKEFILLVLGIKPNKTEMSLPATLYRAGVTNAADKGIDIWTNFGPVVQVKHLSLTKDEIEDIAESIVAERIIIVCLDAEKDAIHSVLNQIGWGKRIQGIITLSDLRSWYDLCLSKYASSMGNRVLKYLRIGFRSEFPMVTEIDAFLKERGYDAKKLTGEWKIVGQAKLNGLS
jgi:type II restriction enzyme